MALKWEFGLVFFDKFAENRKFLIGRFLPYKLGLETLAFFEKGGHVLYRQCKEHLEIYFHKGGREHLFRTRRVQKYFPQC